MDRGLDEIIAEKRSNGPRNRRGGGGGGDRRRDRQERPRDGVKKSYRNEARSIDSEWVHDRFEENDSGRRSAPRRQHESPQSNEPKGTKIKVDNVHYDLTEEDLDELFKRIGPVARLQLRYDRQDRSEGVAFVTYEKKEDAEEAIRQFDGANANGQPIRLTLLSSRNPFDSAIMPGRPLAERISAPGAGRKYDEEEAARKGIDRYVPGGRPRSRSPNPRRRNNNNAGGRRPGARREVTRRDEKDGGRGGRGNARSKKTQEELDAEMADYFTGNGNNAADNAAAGESITAAPVEGEAPAQPQGDDIDMIE